MSFIRCIITVAFVFCSANAVSQDSNRNLRKKVLENEKLFQVNLDKAFSQLSIILPEAEKLQDTASIMTVLERKCRYFYSKEDTNNLITAAEELKNKAIKYKDLNGQAMSHVYLAEAYSINQLFDRALYELDEALVVLGKKDITNTRDLYTRTNILISQGNIFNDKGKPREAVKRLLLAINSYSKIRDEKKVKKFQYINYSNLASIYIEFNTDSAEYYIKKSLEMKPEDVKEDKITSRNYFLLGQIYKNRKDNVAALEYFLKASELKNQSREMHDIQELYTNISNIYKILGKADSAKIYEYKLKEVEIKSLESKYKSLQKVLDKSVSKTEKKDLDGWLWIGLAVLLSAFVLIVLYYSSKLKKNKNKPEPNLIDSYDILVQLAGKNDPAYMLAFEKAFPHFSERLLKINPDLSISEIEFCTLLRLNLSTKKIAQLKFIEPRTVQNKKHRIRKRLNIPTSTDIYNWFNNI